MHAYMFIDKDINEWWEQKLENYLNNYTRRNKIDPYIG
jgi:hypothetical protein